MIIDLLPVPTEEDVVGMVRRMFQEGRPIRFAMNTSGPLNGDWTITITARHASADAAKPPA